jgi:hypothetical protein
LARPRYACDGSGDRGSRVDRTRTAGSRMIRSACLPLWRRPPRQQFWYHFAHVLLLFSGVSSQEMCPMNAVVADIDVHGDCGAYGIPVIVLPTPEHPRTTNTHTGRVMLSLALLVVVPAARATSIVLLRSGDGHSVSVGADSAFTPENGPVLIGCKIAQIEKSYWTAVAEVSDAPRQSYHPYQFAMNAAAHHPNNLRLIVDEFVSVSQKLLPAVAIYQREKLGKESFGKMYEGKPITQVVFWGIENGLISVIGVDFVAATQATGRIHINPVVHQCPPECAASGVPSLSVYLGAHDVIDRSRWTWQTDLDQAARDSVQREIDEDEKCRGHCSPPITVLHMDLTGTKWIGGHGKCQDVR